MLIVDPIYYLILANSTVALFEGAVHQLIPMCILPIERNLHTGFVASNLSKEYFFTLASKTTTSRQIFLTRNYSAYNSTQV